MSAYKEKVKMPNIVMDLNNSERDARFIKLEAQIKDFRSVMESYMHQTSTNFTKLCEGFEVIKKQNDAMPARLERIVSTLHSVTIDISQNTNNILKKLNEFDTVPTDETEEHDGAHAEEEPAAVEEEVSDTDSEQVEVLSCSGDEVLEAADDEIPAEWVE